MKRIISSLISIAIILTILPAPAFAQETGTVTVENEYIRVTVSKENGGYTISTKNGDILKKTDDNKALTHRGENFDTSFTSFQIDGDSSKEYVFGNDYGLFGMASAPVVTESDSAGVTSTWSVNDLQVTQRIELVNSDSSEQLGTAIINYTVKNRSSKSMALKSRVLIDTQLGEKDFGYYEVTKGILGAGYSFIDRETALSGAEVPADYFVKDSAYQPEVAAFGVNSVIANDKPYQMIFAHWANIAATKFDYSPDNNITFSNEHNDHRTADSAAAFYYNLGSIPAEGEKIFSTYYGVTANLKNKDNQVLINTTAPSKLTFNETRTAFIGSSGEGDNIIRINSTITNPEAQSKDYKKLAVVVYTIGFTAQRQTDRGSWIVYDNNDPLYTDVVNFGPGRNLTTFFDFRFEPRDNHELGSFVTRVYNMDPEVNELGVYADKFCLGETINYIFIPAKNPGLPSITLHSMEPGLLFNDDRRFLTVSGQGMSFFKSGLSAIELIGEDKTYSVPVSNMNIAQDTKSISVLLEDYMEPGRYQLHFLWDGSQPEDIPADFTSSAMTVHMTSDESYRNDKYGVLTVQRNGDTKYKIVAFEDETAFEMGDNASGDGYQPEDLIFVLRGELVKDKDEDKKEYRLAGKDKDVTINHILNYHGSDMVIKESESGSVEILMDGKVTTIGANTTVWNGASTFTLESGTKYVIPVYDSRGEIVSGGSLEEKEDYVEDYVELRWNSALEHLQTIGGFLINLKYGVLGKIQDEDDESKTYDIISFGGGLDVSFMTPGGAKNAREEKSKESKNSSWDISDTEDKSGLNPKNGSGPQESKKDATKETTKKDTKKDGDDDDDDDDNKVEFGAHVYDVLYGHNGEKTGHIGINMDANITLPQIVGFLPKKLEGELSVNTIGGYNVGVEGEVETAKFSMGFALVVKSNPSGAPIPDKLFFSIGGFKPGVNIDGLGIFWVTGGGGGFDNLYETIYGTDGVPPITLLLNVQFDIFKIMTGTSDIELSLRSLSIALNDVKLKAVKNAKFLESGEVNLTWYPNFDLSTNAKVNFSKIFKGSFSINANLEKLFEMTMRVTLHIPEDIPVAGGMEVAGAELGGGTEKMWGSVDVLNAIKVGFTYWWDSGNVRFTSADIVSSRSLKMFKSMTEPKQVELDPATGNGQYMAFGTNLSYITGNVADSGLTEERFKQLKSGASDSETEVFDSATETSDSVMRTSGRTMLKSSPTLLSSDLPATSIISNREQTSHIVTLGTPEGDYILTVSRVDGKTFENDFANHIKVWNNGEEFPLVFYKSPDIVAGLDPEKELSDEDERSIRSAAETANVNVVGNVAYIAIPESKQANPTFLIQFDDGRAYDVGAVYVAPIGMLKNLTSSVAGSKLNVGWTAEDVSDKAVVSISVSDVEGEAGILLTKNIPAESGTAAIDIPNTVASGKYYVTVVLQDEEKCYNSYSAGIVDITDLKAPTAPSGAALSNAGNNKLLITVTDDFEKALLEGYYVDVYEDGKLIEAGIFFGKEQVKNGQALIGGRYNVPIMEEYIDHESGETKYRQKTDKNGEGLFREAGYEPGSRYSVKVRAGSTAEGDIYHYSGYVRSDEVALEVATPPVLSITAPNAISVGKDGVDFALTKNTNTFLLKANEPVKGTLTVNGAAGETYSFDSERQSEWTRELTLPDGIYYFEFDAVDQAGNRSIQQAVVNIDATAPVFMLESPVNGGTFTNNEILIKGVADPDAKYTFKVDGVTLGEADRNMSEYFSKGILEYTLSMGDEAARMTPAGRMFEIIAKDEFGNTQSRRMELADSRMSDISRVEIYAGGKPVPTDGILLNRDNMSAKLQLMGFTHENPSAAEQIIDITEAGNVSFTLAAGSSIAMNNRVLSASSGGSSIVLASLDLGGGNTLTDGVVVKMDIYALLNAAIIQAKAIKKGNYTDATWSALQSAIIRGENIINMQSADQEQISNAIVAIQNAIAGLRKKDSSDLTRPDNVEDKKQEPGTGNEIGIPFKDISENDWFYEDVAFAFSNGLFKGISQNEFAPQMTMSRAMLVSVIYRLETLFRTVGENETDGAAKTVYENPFRDVPEGEYYTDAVKWAAANEIIRGTGDSAFDPNGEITREQMAVILYRYLKYAGIEYVVTDEYILFEDEALISDFAKDAVQIMNKLGIIRGTGKVTIAPKDSATRAEVAAMLHRFIYVFTRR